MKKRKCNTSTAKKKRFDDDAKSNVHIDPMSAKAEEILIEELSTSSDELNSSGNWKDQLRSSDRDDSINGNAWLNDSVINYAQNLIK